MGKKRLNQISQKEHDDALQACNNHYDLPSMEDRKILIKAIRINTFAKWDEGKISEKEFYDAMRASKNCFNEQAGE